MKRFVSEEHHTAWQEASQRHMDQLKELNRERLEAIRPANEEEKAELDAECKRHMDAIERIYGKRRATVRPIEQPYLEKAKELGAEMDRELAQIDAEFGAAN